MPKTIQIWNIPDDLHRKLKSRAAVDGLSLSDYLLREIRRMAERPTTCELAERLARRGPARVRTSPTEMLRRERNQR